MKLFPYKLYQVVGYSMSPTLRPGDRVLGRRWFINPKIGDIVIVSKVQPWKRSMLGALIKRVKDVRDNQYWVEGEESRPSMDSRQFGWKSKEQIEAVITKVFPKRF